MFKVKVDPHTHTLFSGHAFSTIEENALHAAELGLEAIGMTDHFSPMFSKDVPGFGPSLNMKALPKVIHGVRILAGTEIDIVDHEGHLAFYDQEIPFGPATGRTVCDMMLDSREIVVASVHYFEGCREGTVAQNTQMYINVLQNPKVDIIGHIGRAGLPFEMDEVLAVAKAEDKFIEINDHSFDSGEPIVSICRDIAIRCAEMGVSIVVSSDAHSSFLVGHFDQAMGVLEEIHFPEELVANLTFEKLWSRIYPRHKDILKF